MRTVRAWDRGRTRVPWAVVRLLRLLRCGELEGISKPWAGWLLRGDRLISPEGREFRAHQMAYWGNTVAMAGFWRAQRRQARLSAASGYLGSSAVGDDAGATEGPLSPFRLEPEPVEVGGTREAVQIDSSVQPSLPNAVAAGVGEWERAGRRWRPARSSSGLVSLCNKSNAKTENEQPCGFPGEARIASGESAGGGVLGEPLSPAVDCPANVQVFGRVL